MKLPSLIENLFRERKSRFTVQIPAEQEDVEKYYEVLAHLFGSKIIPRLNFLKAVPRINPYGLIVIADSTGSVLGGVELYGLRHDFFDDYIAGTKMDSDFREHHLLNPEAIIADGRLYCAITINEARLKTIYGDKYPEKSREIRDHLLSVTVGAIKEAYFSGEARQGSLSIYAIAASTGGKVLLRQIGFGEISDGAERKDKTPLYRLDLTRADVDVRLEKTLNPPERPNRSTPANPRDVKVKTSNKRLPCNTK